MLADVIVYHPDNDGLTGAAIIAAEKLTNPFTKKIFISYNYQPKLNYPELEPGSTIYIVDLSPNDVLHKFITEQIENGCKVILIDHHDGSDKYKYNLESNKLSFESFCMTHIGDTPVSAALLCWLWCKPKDDWDWNFSITGNKIYITYAGNDEPVVVSIPAPVYYVDMFDTWQFMNLTPEQKEPIELFNYGLRGYNTEDLLPSSRFWAELLYNNQRKSVGEVLDRGRAIKNDIEKRYYSLNKCAHEGYLKKSNCKKCLCLNTSEKDSRIIGDRLNEYELFVMYSFNGHRWLYSLRSPENDTGADCAKIAQMYGGGGHKHSAAFSSDELLIRFN